MSFIQPIQTRSKSLSQYQYTTVALKPQQGQNTPKITLILFVLNLNYFMAIVLACTVPCILRKKLRTRGNAVYTGVPPERSSKITKFTSKSELELRCNLVR
jgi:hypothetical protein